MFADFGLEFKPIMSFCGLDGRYRGCMAVFMVYYDFEPVICFGGGYRCYVATATIVSYEFEQDMSFGGGYRGYVTRNNGLFRGLLTWQNLSWQWFVTRFVDMVSLSTSGLRYYEILSRANLGANVAEVVARYAHVTERYLQDFPHLP